jgi:hypothetical protein
VRIGRTRTSLMLATIVLATAGAIALSALLAAARKSTPGRFRGALIPAYGGPDALERLADPGRRRIVIVNPAGGPGSAAQPGYRRAIEAQLRAGADVVGYVPTGYATRDEAAVLADIRRYRAWYGIGGVFIDEVGHTSAQLPYYRSITAPLRAAGSTVVLNPGMVPARGYFDIADVIVTFEGPVDDYAGAVHGMPGWVRALPRARVAHLVYDASEEQATRAASLRAAGYFYATNGTLRDPWSVLPSYLEDVERRVQACP